MRLNTGADTEAPSCGQPSGESIETRIVTAGLLIGAKPVKDAITFVREYLPLAGSIFCAVPVFPPAVHPSSRADLPVPFKITPSISRLIVAAVSGRITRRGSAGAEGPSRGSNCSPRRISTTTRGLYSNPPLATVETALIICSGVTPTSCPIEIDPIENDPQ